MGNIIRPNQEYVSTGQVARLLGCSSRSVQSWVDAGRLPGYRLPRGRGADAGKCDRRVSLSGLRAFLAREGMPLPRELDCASPLLVVTVAADGLAGRLRAVLPPWRPVTDCAGLFELGRTYRPDLAAAVVVDLAGVERADAMRLPALLLELGPAPRLVAVLPEGGLSLAPAECGYTDVYEHPVDAPALARTIMGG